MKQSRYITTTIQAGNRLEIELPNLPIGQTISKREAIAGQTLRYRQRGNLDYS